MNYAEINESLGDIVDMLESDDALNEEALIEAILTEARDDLVDLMESVGYALEAETAEEALEAVAAFMESEEFRSLSEREQQKVKAGWKMVFGKLQKIGQTAKRAGKEISGAAKSGELSQAAREAYRSAKGSLGNALSKTKLGKAADRAGEKFGKTNLGSALGRMAAKSVEKRYDADMKRKQGIKDYWKKNIGK